MRSRYLLSLLFLLFGTAQAQTVVKEKDLHYTVYSVGRPVPTVMLGHGCGGIVRDHMETHAKDLNSWGFNAVIVDSWAPRGVKSTCKGAQPWYGPQDRMVEFYAISERIQRESWHSGKIGYVGFSHGGSLGLNLAADGRANFAAIVSYYPNCSAKMAPASRQLKITTLMHLGGRDSWTPMKECDDIQGPARRLVHPNATHAFDINRPPRVAHGENLEYDAEATARAREATREFLTQHLK